MKINNCYGAYMYKNIFFGVLILLIEPNCATEVGLQDQVNTIWTMPDLFEEYRGQGFLSDKKSLTKEKIDALKGQCCDLMEKLVNSMPFDRVNKAHKRERAIQYVHDHCLQSINTLPLTARDIQENTFEIFDLYINLFSSYISRYSRHINRHLSYYPYPIQYSQFLVSLLYRIKSKNVLSSGSIDYGYDQLSGNDQALVCDLKRHTYGVCEDILRKRENINNRRLSHHAKHFFYFLKSLEENKKSKESRNKKEPYRNCPQSMKDVFHEETIFLSTRV